MSIGINIMKRRQELGMTQQELASKAGYSTVSSITKVETGKADLPASKIILIAKILECSPNDLLTESETMLSPAEINLISDYRRLNEPNKKILLLQIGLMLQSQAEASQTKKENV